MGILSINAFSMDKTNKDSENETSMKIKQEIMQNLLFYPLFIKNKKKIIEQKEISDYQKKICDYKYEIENETLEEHKIIKYLINCIKFLEREEKKAKETLEKEKTMYKLYNLSHKNFDQFSLREEIEIEKTDPFQQEQGILKKTNMNVEKVGNKDCKLINSIFIRIKNSYKTINFNLYL